MNWGNKIIIAFVLFAAFIGYMVVRAFQEDFDLVSEDYYAQEINYQDKLNKLANAERENKTVNISQIGSEVILTFPKGETKASIHFYHPSRQIFDRKFDIVLSDNQVHKIDRSELIAGSYQVNINWQSDSKDYFQQSKIYVQ